MTSRSARLLLACLALFAASCINRDLRPLNPCITSGVAKSLSVTSVDKVDLLLVVDNSNSMREEQRALQQEFPRVIEGLVTGDPDGNGMAEYPPVASLRVAVVSTDLGVGGVGINAGEPQVPTCGDDGMAFDAFRALYGDNGRFNWEPLGAPTVDDPTNCDGGDGDTDPDTLATATLPDFLTFDPTGPLTQEDFADRIGCYAVLGTGGCGFEQQLESMLKSVTPSTSEEFRFFAQDGNVNAGGQGDRDNAGWLRQDALLAVLMVTDEDDCSAADGRVFDWTADAPYNDMPNNGTQANTRCVRFGDEPIANNPNGDQATLLHPVNRYSRGLIALKDNDPAKVVFALITGVPVDTVDGSAPGGTNDGVGNLDQILANGAMAITLAPVGATQNATVAPSCTRCAFGYPAATCALGWNDLDMDGMNDPDCVDMAGGTPNVCDPGEALNCTAELNGMPGCQIDETEVAIQRAVPPRRLVRAAREMQDDGISVIVQSICQDTFTSSVTAILIKISEALNGSCLPNPLNRNSSNLVACEVVEVLPAGRTCEEFAATGRSFRRDEEGRVACTVAQVPVTAETRMTGVDPPASEGSGWYYDDYTPAASDCGSRMQRISFTEGADPIIGSTLRLECAQTVAGDLDGPDVGDPCTQGGTECEMTENERAIFLVRYNLSGDNAPATGPLVCQTVSNTCQVGCASDADCPGGYVCFTEDEGNEGNAFCADPTCQD